MDETQFPRVKQQSFRAIANASTIQFIAEYLMPDGRHMHPQLVGAPGYGFQFDATGRQAKLAMMYRSVNGVFHIPKQSIARKRGFADGEIHLLARTIRPVGGQRQIYLTGGELDSSRYYRDIKFLYCALTEQT